MAAKGVRAGSAYVEIFSDDGPLMRSFKGLGARFDQVGKSFSNFGARASAVGAGLAGIGAAAISWPLQLAANMEATQTAFTTILKDTAKAKALLGEIQQFAASTPFQFDELADASKKLLAFGSNANEVVGELRRIGDIASAVGVPIGELAEIYGKAKVQGRLFAEDINQLTGRGIPVITELAKVLNLQPILDENGKAVVSVGDQLREMVKEGKVGFTELEKVFKNLTSQGGQFAGGMERQSKTLLGLWSTFKDNVALAARTIGDTLIPVFKGFVSQITTVVQAAAEWISRNKTLAAGLGKALVILTAIGGAVFAVGVAFVGLGGAISAVGTVAGAAGAVLAAVFSPAGAVVAGVVAIAAGMAYLLNQAGLLMPAIEGIKTLFGNLFGTVRKTFGGVLQAIGSGRYQLAARIAWEGVKLAALQALQGLLMGVEFIWNNALTLTGQFITSLGKLIVAGFSKVPGLIVAALKGGQALTDALRGLVAEAFSGDGLQISARLDPIIQAQQQRLRQLNAQAYRGGGPMNQRAAVPAGAGPNGGRSEALQAEQVAILRQIQRQGGLQ